MEWGEERGGSRRKAERGMQRMRHTHTPKEVEIEAERPRSEQKDARKAEERRREVAAHTHTPVGGKGRPRHTKRKPPSHAKKGKEKCKIEGEAEGRAGRAVPTRRSSHTWGPRKGVQRKECELAGRDPPASNPLLHPQL